MSTDKKPDTAHEGSARRQRAGRWLVRILMLLAAAILLTLDPIRSRLAVVVPALSPLTAISSVFATLAVPVTAWGGLAVAAVALIRRRWFCRWVCPTGTCADCAEALGIRMGRRCPRLPSIGQWIALVVLSGSLLGMPLLLWLDPLALFSSPFGLLHASTVLAAGWSIVGMSTVLAISLVWPGAWCARICPLGAFQDLIYRSRQVSHFFIDRPAAGMQSRTNSSVTRRVVLAAGLGVVWAGVVQRVRGSLPPPLRPPGAIDDQHFVQLCIRCGNCRRACPTDIIRSDPGNHGLAGFLAPTIDFTAGYCRENCVECTQVCPSGALTPVAPNEKAGVSIGVPRVDMAICLLGDDRECSKCRNWCPYEAIALKFSELEYTLVPVVDVTKCNGCGACELACPTTPAKAIVVSPHRRRLGLCPDTP